MSFPPNLGITTSFIIDSNSSLVFQEFPSLLPHLDQISSPFSKHKMNGYSRIRKPSTPRSKSVDFADLSFPHYTPNICSNPKFKPQEPKPSLSNAVMVPKSIPEHEHEGDGEVFGAILSRKCFVHSGRCNQKVVAEQETVVKKSFSIKRSSSVSEGYSRIHHQSDLAAEDDDGQYTSQKKRDVKKKGKFLKAFKRLFGL